MFMDGESNQMIKRKAMELTLEKSQTKVFSILWRAFELLMHVFLISIFLCVLWRSFYQDIRLGI